MPILPRIYLGRQAYRFLSSRDDSLWLGYYGRTPARHILVHQFWLRRDIHSIWTPSCTFSPRCVPIYQLNKEIISRSSWRIRRSGGTWTNRLLAALYQQKGCLCIDDKLSPLFHDPRYHRVHFSAAFGRDRLLSSANWSLFLTAASFPRGRSSCKTYASKVALASHHSHHWSLLDRRVLHHTRLWQPGCHGGEPVPIGLLLDTNYAHGTLRVDWCDWIEVSQGWSRSGKKSVGCASCEYHRHWRCCWTDNWYFTRQSLRL